jgi:transposase
MIGVDMYHNIQSLKGKASVSEISEETGLARGTVQKYIHMDLSEAKDRLLSPTRDRKSQFDEVSSFVEEMLEVHHRMPAVVLLRKVKEKYPEITGQVRAFRDFLKPYRERFKDSFVRYFHHVKTSKEDSQVQVDIGEFNAFISLNHVKVYFVVFVFSYSRMMFVSYQDRPYNTDDFIKAHLEAFRFFGGSPCELVYDQTKLVVICEKYREVWFNEKFRQFALKNEFLPVVCEGYDPQSKGKVERAIGYVKSSFLECETFDDLEDLRRVSLDWLNDTANCRIHGTTGRRPVDMFEEEKPYLNTKLYLQHIDRQVIADRTNLISFKGNKYSVPHIYRCQKVGITAYDGRLHCHDIVTGKQIAEHVINLDKYQFIIDPTHNISAEEKMAKAVERVKSAFETAYNNADFVSSLIQRIQEDNNNYARGQLVGLEHLANKYPSDCWHEVKDTIFSMPKVKISVLKRLLDISFNNIDFEQIFDVVEYEAPASSSLDRPLDAYMKTIKKGGLNA